jgi:hypothetical protein
LLKGAPLTKGKNKNPQDQGYNAQYYLNTEGNDYQDIEEEIKIQNAQTNLNNSVNTSFNNRPIGKVPTRNIILVGTKADLKSSNP